MTKKNDDVTVGMDAFMQQFSADELKEIEEGTAELMAQEEVLQNLHLAYQEMIAQATEALAVGPDQMEGIAHRAALVLSLLQDQVRQRGGRLLLVAAFPGKKPVAVDNLEDLA